MKAKQIVALCLLLAGCATVDPAHPALMKQEEILKGYDIDAKPVYTDVVYVDVQDNSKYKIKEAGVYVFSGTASEYTVSIQTEDEAWIVLDNVSIENEKSPVIDVKNASKAYIYAKGDNSLATTAKNCPIEASSDIVLCGEGTLRIGSQESCIKSSETIAFVSGTYVLTAKEHGAKAGEAILIVNSSVSINATEDGLHAENSDDDTLGYIYIGSGNLVIQSNSDAIHAGSILQIDGGTIDLAAWEGLESTVVQINNGNITIHATDDGINAGKKSKSYAPLIEINGGSLAIVMAEGDNDAMDSNKDIAIHGGTVEITTGHNAFDYLGNASFTGGTLVVNGVTQTQITKQED